MKKNSKTLIDVCLKCEKIKMRGEWVEPSFEINVNHIRYPDKFNYTYCPECKEYFEKKYKQLKREFIHLMN